MRKVFLTVLAISTVLFISACSSKEEDELLDFHNDLVDDVYPLYDDFVNVSDEISMAYTDEEAYDYYKTDLIPIAEKIEQFFDEQDPETEDAREYYELRNEEYQYLLDFIYEGEIILGEYIDGTFSEAEFDERAEEVSLYMDQHYEAFDQAEERWKELFEEYDFREIKD